MDTLESKTVEILDKLDTLTTQYAPGVVDKALDAVFVTGASNLINGVVNLLLAYFIWAITKRIVLFCAEKKREGNTYNDWDIGFVIAYFCGGITIIVCLLNGICDLVDLWSWVAIFDPELALVHKVLGL